MGSTKLWLPSRKSVDSQRGGRSIVLLGHVLSGRCSGWNFLYFFDGSLSIGILACEGNFFFRGAIPLSRSQFLGDLVDSGGVQAVGAQYMREKDNDCKAQTRRN
jgi:hypothetical protein